MTEKWESHLWAGTLPQNPLRPALPLAPRTESCPPWGDTTGLQAGVTCSLSSIPVLTWTAVPFFLYRLKLTPDRWKESIGQVNPILESELGLTSARRREIC